MLFWLPKLLSSAPQVYVPKLPKECLSDKAAAKLPDNFNLNVEFCSGILTSIAVDSLLRRLFLSWHTSPNLVESLKLIK